MSPATRRRLVDKLFAHPSIPPALAAELSDEASLIETEVFRHATLPEHHLLAVAETGPAMMAAAVAQRPALPGAVVDALVLRPELRVIATLVDNEGAAFTSAQLRALVERAAADRALAERLVPRIADPIAAAPLFPLVSSRVRRGVLDALRRQGLGRRERGGPEGAAVGLSQRLDRLVLGGEWDGFDEVLCGALGAPPARLVPLLHDGRGEVLALAFAALGIGGEVAARAFILGEPSIGRSVAAVRRLTGLVETIPAPAAGRLLAAIQEDRPAERRPAPPQRGTAARRDDTGPDVAPARRDGAGALPQRRQAG